MVSFFVPYGIPQRYRSRLFYRHNPQFILMRTSPKECARLGRTLVQRVAGAKGPSKIVVPSKGWSAYDVEGGPQCIDFEGRPTEHSWFDPAAVQAFTREVKARLTGSHKDKLLEVDLHINEPQFAEVIGETITELKAS